MNSKFLFLFEDPVSPLEAEAEARSGLNCCFSGNNCGSPPASAQYKLSIPELLENLQTSKKFCKIRAIFEELSEKKTQQFVDQAANV